MTTHGGRGAPPEGESACQNSRPKMETGQYERRGDIAAEAVATRRRPDRVPQRAWLQRRIDAGQGNGPSEVRDEGQDCVTHSPPEWPSQPPRLSMRIQGYVIAPQISMPTQTCVPAGRPQTFASLSTPLLPVVARLLAQTAVGQLADVWHVLPQPGFARLTPRRQTRPPIARTCLNKLLDRAHHFRR